MCPVYTLIGSLSLAWNIPAGPDVLKKHDNDPINKPPAAGFDPSTMSKWLKVTVDVSLWEPLMIELVRNTKSSLLYLL